MLPDSALRLGIYALVVVAVTVAAGILPAVGRPAGHRRELGLSLAAGVMLGAAVFHMLPEAAETLGWRVLPSLVAGLVALLVVERFVLSRLPAPAAAGHAEGTAAGHAEGTAAGHAEGTAAGHAESAAADHRGRGHGHAAVGLATFVGLSLHTLVDGIALGSAVESGRLGAVVLAAIVVHKIPLSFSLASVLRQEGRTTARVLWMVAAFGAMVPVGAVGLLLVASRMDAERALAITPHALAFSAGTFLHVIFDDLLPALHRQGVRPVRAVGAFVFGLALTLAAGLLAHGH